MDYSERPRFTQSKYHAVTTAVVPQRWLAAELAAK
jgi:hypothetical protein